MRISNSLFFFLILFGPLSLTSKGNLIISVQDAVIRPGSTGSVDVSISSDAADGLASFANLVFRITDNEPTNLRFRNPQSTSETANSSYVLRNVTGVFTSATENGQLDVRNADTGTGVGEIVPAAPGSLLVRLEVEHDLNGQTFDQALGDEFQIALQGGTFLDDGFLPIAFTSNGGTVTANPEPSTFLSAGLILAGAAVWRRRRSGNRNRLQKRGDIW